jgi:hypothetical protein
MQWMFARVSGLRMFVLVAALMAAPSPMVAQHGGGGHGMGGGMGGGGLSGGGRPSGVDAKDDLKDFHHAMAVQATAEQSTAFASLIATTEAASKMLHELSARASQSAPAAPAEKSPDLAQQANSMDQAIQKARTANKQFLDGFSKSQKSGLKDVSRRLEKADSELGEQAKPLPALVAGGTPDGKQITASAENLDKALTNFYDQQLSLGREMGIELPSSIQEVALDIPSYSSQVGVTGDLIAITTSGKVSKFTAQGGESSFKLEMVADLTNLQQNMSAFLRARLNRSDACGERLAIQRATLSPSVPASFVVVQLHFERWTCGRTPGQTANQIELVGGDGSISLKLTPAVDKDGALKMLPQVTHTEGSGSVGEMLRTGSLGDDLRDNITSTVLSALQQAVNSKKALPAAAQDHATMQQAKFRDGGAGELELVMNGDLSISEEQFKLAAGQLKERVSAEEAAPR